MSIFFSIDSIKSSYASVKSFFMCCARWPKLEKPELLLPVAKVLPSGSTIEMEKLPDVCVGSSNVPVPDLTIRNPTSLVPLTARPSSSYRILVSGVLSPRTV